MAAMTSNANHQLEELNTGGFQIPHVCENAHKWLKHQGPVVQSWFSVKPGLKFNPLFKFVCFNASFHSKPVKRKLQSIQVRFMKKYFQVYK